MNNMLIEEHVKPVILAALQEDKANEDVTTLAIFSTNDQAIGTFLAKENGVVAGLGVVALVFKTIDPSIVFHQLVEDGTVIKKGDRLATVSGSTAALLTGERTALNFLLRMSGIATVTRRFVDCVDGTGAKILDTRKTVPGLRYIDKLSVKLGGGQNHRANLSDLFLIKDNHIEAAGSLTEAVMRCVKFRDQKYPGHQIEVETDTLEQVREAVALPVDIILLDNMTTAQMKEAVQIIQGKCKTEASGGVNLDTVRAIAETGVDYISVGALTHSAPAMDISLDLNLV
jgi:nicotinate-nucleotide pyrophosphorylase (carboxylating)